MEEAGFSVLTTKAGNKGEICNSLVLGLEPRTLCVLGKHSTIELQPHLSFYTLVSGKFSLSCLGQSVTTSVCQLGFDHG